MIKKTCLLLIFSVTISYAQAQFSLNADFRARAEYRDGSRRLLDKTLNPTLVSSQRTRLIADFEDDKFEIKIALQNARIWGQEADRDNVSNINLSEGWIKYHFTQEFSLKVGRQHLVLDDGRVFGMRNWNDIAVSHDLVSLQFEKDTWTIMTGGGYNNDENDFFNTRYDLPYYKYLMYLWLNKKFENGLEISILHSTDANQDAVDFDKIYKRNTTGAYLKYDNDGDFGIQASGYFQYGKHTSGYKQQAYMFSVIPTYEINNKLKTAIGINYFSGNNQPDFNVNIDKNRSFNKLFGDGHRYYGYMDYFLNIESDTKGAGLNELFASIFYKTSEKSELEISYHHFAVSGKLLNPLQPTIAADSELGSEIDIQFKHKINSYLNAAFAYATMFATPSMEILKGGDHNRYQQWIMVMLEAKPALFKADKK